MQNPYFNLATIHNPEMFFGRVRLFKRFYEAIVNRQSVSLLGSLHIGKSSFLWCAALPEIQARFSHDLNSYIFVFIDMGAYLHKSSADFFHRVSKALIARGAELGLPLQVEGQGEDAFSNVLEQVAELGFFPVLLLDNFDTVARNEQFDPKFFGFLRSQASRGLVSYVTASIKPLYEVCHRDRDNVDSPFFNIFYLYMLEDLSPEEAHALITVPAQQAEMPFTDAEVALILKLAGRHPFFIQRVCHIVYEEKLHGTIDESRLRTLAHRDLLPHFQAIWEALSEQQKSVLQDEAQQGGNQKREMPGLSHSFLFRQFVRKTCEVGLFRMTTSELDGALDKIDDLSALGTTNLRLMHLVSQRLGKEEALSTTKRGMVIRDILNEALEQLRGSGSHTSSALDWRYYNILYYRYFKHRLKNEQIAARLGIPSTRQFYRERTKALELLLNALFEMEHAITPYE